MSKKILVCAVILLGLVGCQDESSSEQPEMSLPVAKTTASEQEIGNTGAKGLLRANPNTLASCEPQIVSIAWDISTLAPEINDVEVYADNSLFASGGSSGSSTTGPWTEPGSKFTLKGIPGGEVLDELVVSGPASCGD